MRRTLSAIALAAAALPAAAQTARDDLPLWELGAGLAAAGAPDYPGADRFRARALPLPYGIYRGNVFGAEAPADSDKKPRQVELDVSFGGALPTDSDGSAARGGMPDLDLLLEVGPQLTTLIAQPSKYSTISLALPLRAVFSADFDELRSRGLIFAPELSYVTGKFARRGWNARLTATTTFATTALTDYFYGVRSQYVRDDRPAFAARAGYLESSFTASVSRSFVANTSLFLFARGASLHSAANDMSPLLRDRTNYTFGVGLAYTFLRSERTVAE